MKLTHLRFLFSLSSLTSRWSPSLWRCERLPLCQLFYFFVKNIERLLFLEDFFLCRFHLLVREITYSFPHLIIIFIISPSTARLHDSHPSSEEWLCCCRWGRMSPPREFCYCYSSHSVCSSYDVGRIIFLVNRCRCHSSLDFETCFPYLDKWERWNDMNWRAEPVREDDAMIRQWILRRERRK